MAQTKSTKLAPQELKVIDAELEAKASKAMLPLMELRWRQTIGMKDEKGKVIGYSYAEYGRIIGRSADVIERAAKGYRLLQNPAPRSRDLTPTDAYHLASVGNEEREVVMDVAEALNVSPSEVVKARPTRPDIKAAKEAARKVDPARRQEVAKKAADDVVNSPQRREIQQRAQANEHMRRERTAWIRIDQELSKAKRALREAMLLVRECDLDDEDRSLAAERTTEVKDLSIALYVAIVKGESVDWDSELAKLDDA